MLIKACAGNGESRSTDTLRAHGGSVERSLERIGDEGASQAGQTFSLSVCVSPSLRLSQCGGGGELIIVAVKPSHSLVSISNDVPAIKAL